LYGIIEGPSLGWDDQNVIVAFVAFLLSGAMFVRSQLRSEHPLLPLEFFSQRQFTIGLMAIALAMFVMFSFMFMQMLHFQLVRGLSPLEAAIRFFPLPLGLMPAAANSDRLVGKLGRKKVVTLGLSLVAAGLLLFTLVTTETAYVQIALTFVLLGLGMGLTMAPSTTAIMEAIPESKAGVGSATNDASREVGGALGIAIGGSVLNQIYQKSLVIPESFSHIKDVLSSSFPAAMRVGAETGGPEGAALIASAQEAFVSGMVGSCYVAAAVAAIAAIIVWTKMPDEAATNSTSEE
jgi:MFS family permease